MKPAALVTILVGSLFIRHEWCSAVQADDRVARVFHQACATTRNLRSVEFSIGYSVLGRNQTWKYVENGSSFRAELWEPSASATLQLEAVFAFDGRQHQQFVPSTKLLIVSSHPLHDNPAGLLHPMMVPYYWLFRPGEAKTWTALKDYSTWERRLAESRYVADEMEDGLECCVIEVANRSTDRKATVFFAKQLGMYPLLWKIRDENGQDVSTTKVVKFSEFGSESDRVIVPVSVASNHVGGSDAIYPRLDLLADTVRVNHVVSQDVFHISRSLADEVHDMDKGQIIRVDSGVVINVDPQTGELTHDLSGVPQAKTARPWIWLISGVSVLVGAAFFWVLMMRRG